jgi:hypothetical protein
MAAQRAFLKGTLRAVPLEHCWVAQWAVVTAGQWVAERAGQWVVVWVGSKADPWAAD